MTGERAEGFARARRAAGVVSWSSPHSVALPLEFLQQLGAAPPPMPVCPLEELLADYGEYLSIERGLCDHTVFDFYVPAARLFLSELDGENGPDPSSKDSDYVEQVSTGTVSQQGQSQPAVGALTITSDWTYNPLCGSPHNGFRGSPEV